MWLKDHFTRALKDSKYYLIKHLPSEITIVLSATIASYIWGEEMDKLLNAFGAGILTIIVIILGVFLFHLIFTPRRIYNENQQNIKNLSENINSLKAEIIKIKEPKLQIVFNEDDPNSYVKSFGQQLYRIKIINLSSEKTIKNVKAKFIDIKPMHPVFRNNRPVLLHFMGDMTESFQHAINLDPNEAVYVDVVEMFSLSGLDVRFRVATSELLKQTEFMMNKDDSYIMTIQVSGLETNTIKERFQFGITTNDVSGDWKLWFKSID